MTQSRSAKELKKLAVRLRALEKASSTGGRVARRSARVKLFGALRSFENAINAEHPAIAKPIPKADPSLAAKAERLTLASFQAELRRILADEGYEWNQHEAQLFTNWIFDLHKLPTAPIVLVPGNFQLVGGMDKGLLHVPARLSSTARLVDIFETIARTIMVAKSNAKRPESRPREYVQTIHRVFQAWRGTAWRDDVAFGADQQDTDS